MFCAFGEAATYEIGNADGASAPRIWRNHCLINKLTRPPPPSALPNTSIAGAGVVRGITVMQRYCWPERRDVDRGGAAWRSADGALANRGRDLRVRQSQQTTRPTDSAYAS